MSEFVRDPMRVAKTVGQIFGEDLHAMRVLSLANGVVGTVDAAVLSIHAIGRGYARVTDNDKKHGVKQTDRLLANAGIEVWSLFRPWAQFVVAELFEFGLDEFGEFLGFRHIHLVEDDCGIGRHYQR